MKSAVLVFLAFGLAVGGYVPPSRPSVWFEHNCHKYANEEYIINGVEAEDGKYPYMLSLRRSDTASHVCGASLLTKNWALTAAHCCQAIRGKPAFLYAGSNSLWDFTGSEHDVDSYVMHPKYQPSNMWANDMCLMKVKTPFVFGDRVDQVTLPPQGWPVADGDLLYVTGWGFTVPDTMSVPDRLQLGANFTAFSNEHCEQVTGNNHPSYLCALGGNGRGVCNGDSGSPLMKNGVQVGVASFVYTPCGCGLPDFYSRVPNAVKWVKETLGDEAKDLKFLKE